MEKIIIPQIDLLPDQTLIKDYGQSITFFHDHLIIEARSEYEVAKDDDPAIKEKLSFHNIYAVHKQNLDCIELYHHTKWNVFCVSTPTLKDREIVLSFHKFLDAKAIFDKLYNWKFK